MQYCSLTDKFADKPQSLVASDKHDVHWKTGADDSQGNDALRCIVDKWK